MMLTNKLRDCVKQDELTEKLKLYADVNEINFVNEKLGITNRSITALETEVRDMQAEIQAILRDISLKQNKDEFQDFKNTAHK